MIKVEVGQKVVIQNESGVPYSFETVTKVTKTFIQTEGYKFNLRGKLWGHANTWYYYHHLRDDVSLEEAATSNAEYLKDLRHTRVVNDISNLTRHQWRRLSTEKLEEILMLVSNAQPKEPSV